MREVQPGLWHWEASHSEFPVDWASRGAIAERGVLPGKILEGLRPLLALPVELVLQTHGTPTDRAALERAPA